MTTKPKVIIVAPGRRSKGGITVAVEATLSSASLASVSIDWVETMDDRGLFYKLASLVCALLKYLVRAPFADIVHVHTSSGTSFYRKSVFVVIAILLRKPVILHIHPTHFLTFFEKSNSILKWYIRRIAWRSSVVVALSEAAARALEECCGLDSVQVLPNPCPYQVESRDLDSNSHDILFAGKLMAAKGCYELIGAFAKVRSEFPNARLVMAGNGEVEKFKEFSNSRGLGDYIEFAGWIEGEALLSAYRRAAVFCLPSHSEGLPVSVLQAMSQGATVITTPVGGVPEVIKDGCNGILVPVKEEAALANAMILALSSATLRLRIGENACETIKNSYSVEVIGRQVLSVYTGLLAAR